MAGIIKDAAAIAIKDDMVEATVLLNFCSMPSDRPVLVFLIPPARKQHPRTKSMFDNMLPSILD